MFSSYIIFVYVCMYVHICVRVNNDGDMLREKEREREREGGREGDLTGHSCMP